MALPAADQRESILDNIEAQLNTIKKANSVGGVNYSFDIEKVVRNAETWNEAARRNHPVILIGPGTETFRHTASDQVIVDWRIDLYLYVAANDASDRFRMLNLLLRDVVRCLYADTTRGANAIQTTLTERVTDELDQHGQNSARFTFTVQVEEDFT
jgi:hypothetical protein